MKTKTILFYILFFLFNINAYSQQRTIVYFDSIYDCNNNKLAGTYTVYETQFGYFTVGISKNIQNRKVICVLKTDEQGNKLEVKNFGKTNCDLWPGAQGSLTKTNDGGYALGGAITSSLNDKVLLVKFDANGDTLWTREYGDNVAGSFVTGRQCKQTKDKGYIIVGEKYFNATNSDVLIIKTDSLGNFQWQKNYGDTNIDIGWTIAVTPDSGFIIGGYTYRYGISNSHNALVIKTDSLGNVQWQKEFGGIFDDGTAIVNVAKDGNLFVTLSYAFSEPYPGVPVAKLNVIKLDISGNIIWDKKVGPLRYMYYMDGFYELPNGNIVTAGYHFPETGVKPATIFLLSYNGDSIWMRDYNRLINNGSSYLYNIQQTSDNGLIACGMVFGAFEPPNGQNMWLLKMDSVGCLEPGCDGSGFVEIKENNGLIIYPNPSHDKISLTLKGFQTFSGLTLSIYSIQGQMILQQNLQQNNSEIDISELEQGVYIAKVVLGDGSFVQEKFIVIK